MSTFTPNHTEKFVKRCLQLWTVLFFLMLNVVASASEEEIYDDKETLVPSLKPEKHAGMTQASANSILADVLLWRLRALEIYSGEENTYRIPVLEETENEIQRTVSSQRRNIYVPTYVYLAAGDEITLYLKEYPNATTHCSAHTYPNFDRNYAVAETNPMVLSANINQTYRATSPGLLMLTCKDTDKDMTNWSTWGTTITIKTSNPGKKSALYIYGVTPLREWPAIATAPDPSGQVYLFNGRTVMNFPASVALLHADKNIEAMMQEHLIITSRFNRLNGLGWQLDAPLDTQPLSMYQASFTSCCSSSSNDGLVKINFGGDRIASHWGDWHEYGHQNQMAWKWSHLTEISNNLFSLEACQMLTGKKTENFTRCHSRYGSYITSDPESVGRFLAMDGLPETPDEPADRSLLMLGQLYISFPDWHPQLAKDFRAAYARGENAADFSTEEKKIDWFVLNTSRIVGRDLRGFFDKWGQSYSAESRQAIAALNLPEPIRPSIQHSAEWNISASPVIEGTIPVPLLQHSVGLVAYGREEGPTALQMTVDESYTTLTTLLVGSKRVPHPVVLRGTLKHGSCSSELPMHEVSTCISGNRNVYWKLTYVPEDNPIPLPDDNYEGVLRLGIRATYDVNWGGTLTVPIKFNIAKSQ